MHRRPVFQRMRASITINDMVVSKNRDTPSHHPFLDGMFPYRPFYLGGPHISGNYHMFHDIRASFFDDKMIIDDLHGSVLMKVVVMTDILMII